MGNPGSWAASKDRVGEAENTESKGKIKDDFRSVKVCRVDVCLDDVCGTRSPHVLFRKQ